MFDIGFSELLVIAVVALIVIGPERLPKVARTAGHLFGRLQRYVNDVKADINREMELEELRKLKSQVQDAARSIEQSVSGVTRDFESGVRNVERELGEVAAGSAEGPPGSVTAATSPVESAPPLAEPASPPAPGQAVQPDAAKPHAAQAQPTPPQAVAPQATPPRQAALPGFDRI